MATNEAIQFYKPGMDITGHTTAAVIGKRFVAISGDRQSGPGLSAMANVDDGSNYRVAHAAAAGRIFGVAAHDAAINKKVNVIRGGVVPVTTGAAIAAFAEVEVGANGTAVPKATGIAVGYALTAATSGGDAEISLY